MKKYEKKLSKKKKKNHEIYSAELQLRSGFEDCSVIFFLISQCKYIL